MEAVEAARMNVFADERRGLGERALEKLAADGLNSFFSLLIADTAKLYPEGAPIYQKSLLVHSSLSSFGFVPGGERTVTEALIRSCAGARLTLAMPAHGGADCAGKDCLAMGRIPDYFRRRRGTKRSAHPYLSFCALGPSAKKVLKNHRAQNGVGMESPAGKLYETDAIVLMLGTGYETCTVMHLAEYAEAERMRANGMVPDTVTCWSREKSWEEPAFHPELFPAIGEAFEREKPERLIIRPLPDVSTPSRTSQGGLTTGKNARAMRIRDLVDFSIDRYRYLR
jgi:aminoglycoside 3-N-acetyltransferase